MSPVEIGKNGKTYDEAFASFRDEVLDILDMKRTGEKFKRELLSKSWTKDNCRASKKIFDSHGRG